MAYARSAVVDAPLDDVFTWFSRPGAFARLSPPWQPLALASEAESLADGTAVLALPGGLRWVARHDPTEYVPSRRFVDEVVADGPTSLPAGWLRWRHTHEFESVDTRQTRVTDTVDTQIPRRLLDPIFDYRARQLADDLAAHRRAAEHGMGRTTVAITGSSGLVGSALTAFLTSGGHDVIRLVRRPPTSPDERRWDPAAPASGLLEGVDAVIHLAGASIAGRFSDAHKKAVEDSRIGPTRRLAEAAATAGVATFVSASAIGVYGAHRGDESLPEDAAPPTDSDFLQRVVTRWEDAAAAAASEATRVVTVRTGIVQSPRGGTLRLLRPLFAAGLGGRLGTGRQWLSWIGLDDLVDIYHRALWDTTLAGPVNAVAPAPVRNSEYTRILARVLRRPALLPVPSFGPRLLLGAEGNSELAEASQRVVPARLQAAGHPFRTPDLESALRHLLGKNA